MSKTDTRFPEGDERFWREKNSLGYALIQCMERTLKTANSHLWLLVKLMWALVVLISTLLGVYVYGLWTKSLPQPFSSMIIAIFFLQFCCWALLCIEFGSLKLRVNAELRTLNDMAADWRRSAVSLQRDYVEAYALELIVSYSNQGTLSSSVSSALANHAMNGLARKFHSLVEIANWLQSEGKVGSDEYDEVHEKLRLAKKEYWEMSKKLNEDGSGCYHSRRDWKENLPFDLRS